jgi:PIN domain nuclease of toxin-antitoxin system
MKLLIDTQAVIWWLGADPKLTPSARAAMARTGSSAGVSAASVWEASIKTAAGKLSGPDFLSAVSSAGMQFLRIDEHHAKLAGELPLIHRDPFDRMLVAQAILEQLTIVTSDTIIPRYGVPVLW